MLQVGFTEATRDASRYRPTWYPSGLADGEKLTLFYRDFAGAATETTSLDTAMCFLSKPDIAR